MTGIKEKFNKEVAPALQKKFGYKNRLEHTNYKNHFVQWTTDRSYTANFKIRLEARTNGNGTN